MTVLLIGCGRMGGAMARSWIGTRRVFAHVRGSELPAGVERVERLDRLTEVDDLVVVLAVKPQVFPEIAGLLTPLAIRGALFLSIMAGISIERLSEALGGHRRIVRAMPNTPAAIGKGITAAVATDAVSEADKALVAALLAATGEQLWLDDEADLDLVTAISGSGPAYFFRMTEALAEAGIRGGLAPSVAMRLAHATFTGAAALAEADPAPLSDLREQVTSPGGTTAAGLERLTRGCAIDTLIDQAVSSAAARSRELGQ